MEDKVIDNKALSETYVVLNRLSLLDKIPVEFQEYISNNKDDNYDFDFNENAPLFNQLDNQTTRNLLTYIYMKYIYSTKRDSNFILSEVMDILNKYKNS